MEWILNIAQIAEATGGEICNCNPDEIVKDVVRDSREVEEGVVFLALNGENNNGHKFVPTAIENGAICCVVNRDEGDFGKLPVIKVDDTFKALMDIASYYRMQFDIPIVGITGSVGKTSTKEMIACVLGEEFKTHKTEGNYNNEVGVPLTLLRLSKDDDISVIEMGMSNFGEISRLTNAVKPDTAVITNIGVSHIENLGSREGIRKAKFEIFEGLSVDGTVILNGDDPYLWSANGDIDYETLYYGIENKACDIVAKDIKTFSDSSEFTLRIDGEEYRFEINAPGVHHIYNALAAVLVGIKYNMSVENIVAGIKSFEPSGHRQVIVETDKFTIIEDYYNASPDSMQSGLNVLSITERGDGSRKVACLADMLELGNISKQAHRQVGHVVADSKADCLIVIGNDAKYIAEGAVDNGFDPGNIYYFENNDKAKAELENIVRDGDIILIKGSRGMRLEEIANYLENL